MSIQDKLCVIKSVTLGSRTKYKCSNKVSYMRGIDEGVKGSGTYPIL